MKPYPESDLSYYAASAPPQSPAAPLQGTVSADVCVVGGGLAGLASALELAERGQRVVVLEAERVGWGASGRSGGQVLFGVAASQDKLEKLLGAAQARAVWDLTLAAVEWTRERIGRHRIDCDWTPGQMHVAVRPRQVAELAAWQEELGGKLGYHATRLVGREELRQLVDSPRYLAGLLDARGGHLHPLKYTQGLAAAARAAGVVLHEGTRAVAWTREPSGTVVVRTLATGGAGAAGIAGAAGAGSVGEVRCQHLVLAGNAYLGGLAPALARKIMAVGTYIVATEKMDPARARSLISNNAAVTDLNWVLDYFRLSADHRLLFGGRVSYSGLDPFNTARATRARMLAVYPQLADLAIEFSWGGYVDITMNRAPHFGRLAPNVWFLQGFSGHGMALTGIAGKLLAEAVAGSAERFDVFARIPHRDFPGGVALRRPALVLAMLWYRLRDLL